MIHSKPVGHLKHLEHLEHLEHLKILKCPSVIHFQVLNRFKIKILSPALNYTLNIDSFYQDDINVLMFNNVNVYLIIYLSQ